MRVKKFHRSGRRARRDEGGEKGEGKLEGNSAQITEKVIGAAIEVHRHLGPGLLEST